MSASAGCVPSPSAASSTATDPESVNAIESLYRDSGRRHPALRPFETALHPPEGADGYNWLYRAESVAPAVAAAPASPTTLTSAVLVAPVPLRRWLVPALVAAGAACLALAGLLLTGPF
jgi:hypothetical protein